MRERRIDRPSPPLHLPICAEPLSTTACCARAAPSTRVPPCPTLRQALLGDSMDMAVDTFTYGLHNPWSQRLAPPRQQTDATRMHDEALRSFCRRPLTSIAAAASARIPTRQAWPTASNGVRSKAGDSCPTGALWASWQ